MTPDKKADRKTRKRRHRKEAGSGCKCPSLARLFEDPRLEIGPPYGGDRRCEAQRGGEMIAVVS